MTGATGTVGSPLVDALHDRGVQVRAAVRNPAIATLPSDAEVVADHADAFAPRR
ncbi:NAD(P)H-binding protein [Haloarchaeobius sp. HME9146]|uniref:NAD(P)H-binding protein n=1 Tax=Haloarchaeobius sp. HME9146 TaxID=2978732 RepID=UPI0021C052EE|nr:NAD(P)H-binding protein [Haloarchaeobius sp. HME9146]